jgi:hypothetical protein
MATANYRSASTSPRPGVQSPRPHVAPTAHEKQHNTAIWIVVAVLAIAAIAFAMGAFNRTDDGAISESGIMMNEAPSQVAPGTPDTVQTGGMADQPAPQTDEPAAP